MLCPDRGEGDSMFPWLEIDWGALAVAATPTVSVLISFLLQSLLVSTLRWMPQERCQGSNSVEQGPWSCSVVSFFVFWGFFSPSGDQCFEKNLCGVVWMKTAAAR